MNAANRFHMCLPISKPSLQISLQLFLVAVRSPVTSSISQKVSDDVGQQIEQNHFPDHDYSSLSITLTYSQNMKFSF